MIKTLILLITFSLSAISQCRIESFDVIIKFNKILDESIIKASNCDASTKHLFLGFISNIEGKIPEQQLKNIFKSEYNKDVQFLPKTIHVSTASEVIEEKLKLNNIFVQNVHSLYGNASLNLNKNDNLRATCSNCNLPGEKNIKLQIGSKQIWLSANFLVKRRAFTLKKDISPFKDTISKAMVEETSILDIGSDQLFSDYENIKYYRANKNLLKGQVIKINDLSPKVLVKYNQNVEVVVKGSKVALKSRAVARQAGKLGEVIKLYNPKSKKIINAKVIDFNKVMVEL
jgi:flagella basal body P-ring formation protein FlgA